MARRLGALVITTLMAGAWPAGAAAPPSGSYLQSCGVQSFDGRILAAFCAPEQGHVRNPSNIDVSQCGEPVFNRDGGLQCFARQGSWGSGRAVPHGSYIDSCRNVFVGPNQNDLIAECKNRDGRYFPTNLPLRGCRRGGPIDNDNGQLVCR